MDAITNFETAVSQIMRNTNCSRQDAINAVKRRDPKLSQGYILATNPGMRQQRELSERFEAINSQIK